MMTKEELAEIERKTEEQIQTRREFFESVIAVMELERQVLVATTPEQLASHLITACALFTKVGNLNLEYSKVLTKAIMAAMISQTKGEPS